MSNAPFGVTTQTTGDPFPGYNLRGLIMAYLESRGWSWSFRKETWILKVELGATIEFDGIYATDHAVRYQIALEEGRL